MGDPGTGRVNCGCLPSDELRAGPHELLAYPPTGDRGSSRHVRVRGSYAPRPGARTSPARRTRSSPCRPNRLMPPPVGIGARKRNDLACQIDRHSACSLPSGAGRRIRHPQEQLVAGPLDRFRVAAPVAVVRRGMRATTSHSFVWGPTTGPSRPRPPRGSVYPNGRLRAVHPTGARDILFTRRRRRRIDAARGTTPSGTARPHERAARANDATETKTRTRIRSR